MSFRFVSPLFSSSLSSSSCYAVQWFAYVSFSFIFLEIFVLFCLVSSHPFLAVFMSIYLKSQCVSRLLLSFVFKQNQAKLLRCDVFSLQLELWPITRTCFGLLSFLFRPFIRTSDNAIGMVAEQSLVLLIPINLWQMKFQDRLVCLWSSLILICGHMRYKK